MGCECKVYLPNNVRLRDVSDVIGILCGKDKIKVPLKCGDNLDTFYCKVDGVKLIPTHIPEMTVIQVLNPISKDSLESRNCKESPQCHYFFECSENPKYRLLLAKSTSFWVAIGKELVKFFGGQIDYNDCDVTPIDMKVKPKRDRENCPTNGIDWEVFEQKKLNLFPLTKQDFERVF